MHLAVCRIIMTGVVLTGVMLGPAGGRAQSTPPPPATQELTVDIAEKALAPGTTRAAAEAWLRYWSVNAYPISPEDCRFLFKIKPLPGTAQVLWGSSRIHMISAISWHFVDVYIFLDAQDRVVGTVALDGIGME